MSFGKQHASLQSVEPKYSAFVPYGRKYTGIHTLRAMGQKNCSIKDEDELASIIGKYRMTSELHWVDFKAGVDNQMKQTVVKKDSYSSDSLDEFCEESTPPDTDKSKESSDEIFDRDMNNKKSLSQSSSDISSVHDNSSITSTYSFEIVEETEALQTENITESVDIRISPRNSTVMSYNCSNNFYSEFSLVANVEVQIPDANENVNTKGIIEKEDTNMHDKNGISDEKVLDKAEMLNGEDQREVNDSFPDIQSMDINANDAMKRGINGKEKLITDHEIPKKSVNSALEPPSMCGAQTPQKMEYHATKIEIARPVKRVSSIERKIAEEIKEMEKREEDLRYMREKLAKEMSEKFVANEIPDSDPPAFPKPEKVVLSTPSCDEKPIPKKVAPTTFENAYTKACVFAIKRKDVAVKTNNFESNSRSSSANSQQETPVEREIRIAKEREEELKREREQALKAKLEMDSINSEYNETDVDSALSICSDSSFDSVSKLAPLFPTSASPEMTNGNGISLYSSSAGSICSLESLSQRERQNNGFQSAAGSNNGSFLSPSPDCKPGFPFATPKISPEKRGKNIDMERFISSKGKEIKFKGDSGIATTNYYEIKPPQIKKGEEKTCKRFITAAAKIQNELKEMQEREEQFKKERESRQQDINNLKNGDGPDPKMKVNNENDSHISSPTQMNNSDCSGDVEKTNNNKQDNSANPARRRSVLIDEWEQRILKSSVQP